MDFQNIRPAIVILLVIAVMISAKAEKSDAAESPPNMTPESVIEDLRNSTPATEGKSRVKRQFGGYGYPDPYYGRRRILPYPPIIFGGIGFGGGVGFGRGFGGRGFGGRGFGGRGIGGRGFGGRGFGGRGGGFGGRGGGFGGSRGGGGRG